MSSFSGFTEADIKKLQNGGGNTITPNLPKTNLRQKATKKPQDAKKMVLENKIKDIKMELPNEAMLAPPNIAKTMPAPAQNNQNNDKPSNNNDNEVIKVIPLEEKEITTSDKKSIDLEALKTKQKLMEEQNRIRKEQLAKALADRTKRTQEEQKKLFEIQDEFKKLDANLTNDVKILRKQIENASYDYMEAQKRYHKVEKEFLDAKLFLHQKLEKKEMLTEHLCTIIEKNEERKAVKLNELLQKLTVLDVNNENENNHTKKVDALTNDVQDIEITSNNS